MAIDRDAARAAKARRRAQRMALRGGRPRGPMMFSHVPAQPERPAETPGADDAESAPPLGTWGTPELPEHFVSADDLAAQGSEAERLQAEVAGIRELLDRPLAPVQTRARRRPGAGFWLAVLVVVAVMAFLLLTAVSIARDDHSAGSPAPSAARSAPNASNSTGSGTGPSTGAGQVRGLPTTGAGIDQQGAALGIQVLADQSIAVTEQAVLADPGLSSFDLSLPLASPLPSGAPKLKPAIKELTVSINGAPAEVTPSGPGEWTVVPPAGGARTVLLRYRLVNAVALSQPSAEGRALAVVTPLLAELLHDGNHPVDLLVPADGVSNVTCLGAPKAKVQCGAHRGSNYVVTIPDDATSAAILLQLNLR